MAKTGNTREVKVQIWDAEANTNVLEYYTIDEHDSVEENELAVD